MNTNQITMRKSIHRSIALAALSAALSLGYSGSAIAQDAEVVAQAVPVPQVQEGPQDFQAQDGGLQQNFQQRQERGGGRGRGNQQLDPNNPDFQGGPGGGGRARGGRGRTQDPNQIQDYSAGGGGNTRRGRVDPLTGEVMRTNGQTYVPDPSADAFTQEYAVIFQHNIFLRNRVYTPPVERVAAPPRPPEELNVLVGVVKEDDGAYRAYIEDLGQRMLHKLTLNDAIANGKITDVSMSSIRYSVEGKPPVTVPVGANLTGAGGSRISTLASVASRTDYTGFSQGQNNLPTNARGGRAGQTGTAGQFTQTQTFAGGAQGAAGRGRGGAGGQQFVIQNAAPVLAPQPLPGTDNMSIEERMRLRRTTEGQPSAAIQMTGTQPTVAAPVVEPTPAPAAPIVDPSIGAGLSLEEQMRLRRIQEGQR